MANLCIRESALGCQLAHLKCVACADDDPASSFLQFADYRDEKRNVGCVVQIDPNGLFCYWLLAIRYSLFAFRFAVVVWCAEVLGAFDKISQIDRANVSRYAESRPASIGPTPEPQNRLGAGIDFIEKLPRFVQFEVRTAQKKGVALRRRCLLCQEPLAMKKLSERWGARGGHSDRECRICFRTRLRMVILIKAV